MGEAEDPRPGSGPMPRPTTEIDCAQAWKLIERACAGGLPGSLALALRRHMAGCPDCKGLYRTSIESTAALARSVRGRADHPSRAAGGWTDRRLYRRRRTALLFVVASCLIAMVARLDGDWEFDPTLTLEWVEGEAWAGGELVDAANPEVRLARSDLVLVEPGGRARIRARRLELEVEPSSRLLVISAATRRLRLEQGQVILRGSGELETPRGIVEVVDGEARIQVDAASLAVRATAGEVRRIDAGGVHAVEPAGRTEDGPG